MSTTVAVLSGGPSSEHEVSLLSGVNICEALQEAGYIVRAIFIDKDGTWHERGRPRDESSILSSVDVVYPALHGAYGEDGKVQQLCERYAVPCVGSQAFASALAMHKQHAKNVVEKAGIKVARGVVITPTDAEETLATIMKTLSQPLVVKPLADGSSVGVQIVYGFEPLMRAVTSILEQGQDVLVEERIVGREATVGVIDSFRDQETYVLPPIEIIPPSTEAFFSHKAKYSGETQELCPGNFSKDEVIELARLARLAHTALGARGYSRSDFIIAPRGMYFLEINTLPGMTSESLFPKMLDAVGSNVCEFVRHVVELALRKV